jgi:diguanylate cyclase (GGDEF)-like protein
VEMLVADSSHAHFHQTLRTDPEAPGNERTGCGVVSPADCPATQRSQTLVFPSSRALDACPYLVGRASGDLSAACVAISITGQTSGVVHATGKDGRPPTESDVTYLELTSRHASERIAMLRAFEKSEVQARTDPLTGLWNRRSLENRINELQREDTPYALAYGDLDHFKLLNDTYGHEAGDQALRLFARVLRDSVRPSDVTARYGGEEFVIVLPDCDTESATKILERVRERLVLTLASGRTPAFTASFGLASSIDGDTFVEVVAIADQALLTAKARGRNRTVLASDSTPRVESDAP